MYQESTLRPAPAHALPDEATSTLLLTRTLCGIQQEMEKSGLVEGAGLQLLIKNILEIIWSGKATKSALAGKIRELMYGSYFIKQIVRVQFGLMRLDPTIPVTEKEGGAGGDITLFEVEQFYPNGCRKPTRVIQSKYITGKTLSLVQNNLLKAVIQLPGVTGEMPYVGAVRVADLVIEESDAAPELLKETEENKQRIFDMIVSALDDDGHECPSIHLWTQVDEIHLTVKKNEKECVVWEILVSEGKMQHQKKISTLEGEIEWAVTLPYRLMIKSVTGSSPLLFKDFPYECLLIKGVEHTISLGQLVIDCSNEIGYFQSSHESHSFMSVNPAP